jgi:ABC-type microcin C transport system permease subunit YejE
MAGHTHLACCLLLLPLQISSMLMSTYSRLFACDRPIGIVKNKKQEVPFLFSLSLTKCEYAFFLSQHAKDSFINDYARHQSCFSH